jgi:IclR family transcriptional regulator, acetate operon repressor
VLHSDIIGLLFDLTLGRAVAGVKVLQTVERALAVLDLVAERQPVGVSEVAREMQIDKSAAQRILVSLHSSGWIRADGSAPVRWVLTTKPLQLARQVTGSPLVARARPVLEQLRDDTGETVWLALLDGGEVVAVDGVESRQTVRTSVRRGLVLPLLTSASGKAILAAADSELWHRLMPQDPPPALRTELETARRAGYAVSVGEVDPTVHTVSAAVISAGGEPIGALIVAAPADRMPRRQISQAGRCAAARAAELSRVLR